jgi:RNA polymerase sigma-70 factor, ECF subfamily
MPPLGSWYRGLDAITVFLTRGPLSGNFRWRHVPAHANGQPAVGCYTWHPEENAYLPFALDVLTLRGDRIQEVTAFIARTAQDQDPGVFARWPDQPADPSKVSAIFERLGLPRRLD